MLAGGVESSVCEIGSIPNSCVTVKMYLTVDAGFFLKILVSQVSSGWFEKSVHVIAGNDCGRGLWRIVFGVVVILTAAHLDIASRANSTEVGFMFFRVCIMDISYL